MLISIDTSHQGEMFVQCFHVNLTAINGMVMFLDGAPTTSVIIDITVSADQRSELFTKIKSLLLATRNRVAFMSSEHDIDLETYFRRLTCNDSGAHLNNWGIQNSDGWTAYYSVTVTG